MKVVNDRIAKEAKRLHAERQLRERPNAVADYIAYLKANGRITIQTMGKR
jgi:hypothetical protein